MRIRVFHRPSAWWVSSVALALLLGSSGCDTEEDPTVDTLLASIRDAEDGRGAAPLGLDPILNGLESANTRVQAVSVRALGRMENPDHIGLIAPLLNYTDPDVRSEAANALGQAVFSAQGDSVAVLLHARLPEERDAGVRGAIGRTLGRVRYGTPSGIQEAEASLVDLTFTGSGFAPAEALLGAVMGLEWLARRNRGIELQESTQTRLATLVTYGLPASGEEGEEAKSEPRIRRVALMALSSTGGVTQETLAGALEDPDPDVRRIAVSYLARNPASKGTLAALERALGDDSPRVRIQALTSYVAVAPEGQRCSRLLDSVLDEETQVAITAIVLLSDPCPDPTIQIQTFLTLAEAYDARTNTRWHRGTHAMLALAQVFPQTASPLVRTFADHESPFARVYAARAAVRTEDQDLLERLAQDPTGNVRTEAVRGLFQLRGHAADEILLAQLDQDDPQLLLTVAGLLEDSPNPDDTVAQLLKAFHRISAEGRETARDPRMGILERLSELGGLEIAEELEPYLGDYDPAVATRVADVLTEWTGAVTEASPQPPKRLPLPSPSEIEEIARSRVVLEMEGGGDIEIRLLPDLAPTNAARFLRLARAGYFEGLTFHRIVSNFVVQGGSPHANEMSGDGPFTRDEIGLQSNWRGTIGTSTRGRDTGDGQVFINLVDNLRLDHNYTIFGEVVAGMEVVDRVVEGQVIQRVAVRK